MDQSGSLRSAGARVALFFLLLCAVTGAEVVDLPELSVRPELETTTGSYRQLRRESLLQNSAADLLRTSPSLMVSDDSGGGPLGVSIRGQRPEQTRYFLEGIPLSDAQFNVAPAHLIPQESIRAIDVYSGGVPASMIEDGLAGAIDFHILSAHASARDSLGARVGSYGDVRLALQASDRNPTVRLDLAYARNKGDFLYNDDNGTPANRQDDSLRRREQEPSQAFAAMPRIRLLHRRGMELDWLSLHALRESGFAGPTFARRGGLSREMFHLGLVRADWREAKSRVRGKLYGMFDGLRAEGAPIGLARLSRSAQWTVGTKWDGTWQFAAWKLVGAVGARGERYLAFDSGERESASDRLSLPLGAQISRSVGEATELSVGGVWHQHFYSAQGPLFSGTKNFSGFSPRVGAKARSGVLDAELSAGRYFRSPSSFELFGGAVGIEPNQDLRAEHAWQGEVKLSWSRLGPVQGALSVGASQAEDLISFVQTAQNAQSAQNIDRSRVVSAELELRSQISSRLILQGWLVWSDSRNQSAMAFASGKMLPLYPRWRAAWSATGRWNKWQLAYRFDWMASRYADLANLKEIAPVGDHSVAVAYQAGDWGELRMEVKNLTDATTTESRFEKLRAFDYTTGIAGYPSAGRRIYFTWTYPI